MIDYLYGHTKEVKTKDIKLRENKYADHFFVNASNHSTTKNRVHCCAHT